MENKLNDYVGIGYLGEKGDSITINTNVKREMPSNNFRWVKKKNGEIELQQMFYVSKTLMEQFIEEWKPIKIEEEQ